MRKIKSLGVTQRESVEQKKIQSHLEIHPKVARIARFNSGCKGRIKFNTLQGCPDLLGYMRDGRILMVEVKNSDWKGPCSDHEKEQAELINHCLAAGGVAYFAAGFQDHLQKLQKLIATHEKDK